MIFFLGYLWALPITVAGWILAVATGCHYLRTEQGALMYEASEWFRTAFFLRFNVAAFCWAAIIIGSAERLTAKTIKHELVHFKQARIFGVFLPILYGVGALIALARGGSAYRDCFLETWARKEAGDND